VSISQYLQTFFWGGGGGILGPSRGSSKFLRIVGSLTCFPINMASCHRHICSWNNVYSRESGLYSLLRMVSVVDNVMTSKTGILESAGVLPACESLFMELTNEFLAQLDSCLLFRNEFVNCAFFVIFYNIF